MGNRPINGKDTQWRYPRELLAPLHWYISTLVCSGDDENNDAVITYSKCGVTWLELALDFYCSTHTKPKPAHKFAEPDHMFKMQEYFAAAFMRVIQMCDETLGNIVSLSKRTPSGLMLELPPLHGWAKRPILKCNDHVAANVLNIIRTNRGNRHTANIGIHQLSAPSTPI